MIRIIEMGFKPLSGIILVATRTSFITESTLTIGFKPLSGIILVATFATTRLMLD